MASSENVKARRQAILAAAEKVFDTYGYATTTVDAVAAEAGISKGSIYNYFHSKEDLFHQVFNHAVSGMEADTVRLLTEPISASEKLHRLVDQWFQRLEYARRIGRLVLEFWATAARHQQGELAVSLREVYLRWRHRVSVVLAEGVEQGQFKPQFGSPFAGAMLLALLDGIQVQSQLGFGVDLGEEFLATFKSVILTSIMAKGTDEEKT